MSVAALKPSASGFELPDLPYAQDALEPHISARTLGFHHGKHHAKYVETLNQLIADTELADKPLEDIILAVKGDAARRKLFNQAAQVWNHTFFWHSMKPGGGGRPSGTLAQAIDRDFGSFDDFAQAFRTVAANEFGSGWAWLVIGPEGKLEVISTHDADLPLAHGKTALVTLDVWEHAYYLDYQNRRPDFISAFLDHLVNWDFAQANFDAAS